MTNTPVSSTSKAALSGSTLLFILGMLSAFGPLATDMYLSGFSLIADTFKTQPGLVSISLSIFFFGLAAGQLVYGPLIDQFGRKPLLLIGVFVFAVSSLLIAFAPSIHFFIAFRLLQALGSCAGMVIARAVVGDLYEEKGAARFFSLIMIVTIIAPIIAPTLGGFLIQYLGWKAVFYFLAVFGFFGFWLVQSLLPETLHPDQRAKTTLGGILRAYGHLLLRRHFILPTLVCAISYGELFAFISGSPFVYINLHGVSPQNYGLLYAVNALGMIVAAKANHVLLKRMSPIILLSAFVLSNLLFSLILFFFAAQASLPLLIFLILFSLIGIPSIGANAMAMAMNVPADLRGSASALLGVLQFGIASLSSAIVGALYNETVYPMVGVILACSFVSALLLATDRTLK